MSHDPYNTTNEDAVSNLSMLSTSTMRSSLHFQEKPDPFEQQARSLADVLELHQDVRDRQASGTSSNSQGQYVNLQCNTVQLQNFIKCVYWGFFINKIIE